MWGEYFVWTVDSIQGRVWFLAKCGPHKMGRAGLAARNRRRAGGFPSRKIAGAMFQFRRPIAPPESPFHRTSSGRIRIHRKTRSEQARVPPDRSKESKPPRSRAHPPGDPSPASEE